MKLVSSTIKTFPRRAGMREVLNAIVQQTPLCFSLILAVLGTKVK
jgi:hypothetical protein